MIEYTQDIIPWTANEILLQNKVEELTRENNRLKYDARLYPSSPYVDFMDEQFSKRPLTLEDRHTILKPVVGASVNKDKQDRGYCLKAFMFHDYPSKIWQHQVSINNLEVLSKRDRVALTEASVMDVMKALSKAFD
jgi:hypothetical protein